MCKFKSILDDSYRVHIQIDKEASKARNAIKERRQSLQTKITSAEQEKKENLDRLNEERTRKLHELVNDNNTKLNEKKNRIDSMQDNLTNLKNDCSFLLTKADNNTNNKKKIIDKIVEFIRCENLYSSNDNFISLLSANAKTRIQGLSYLSYYHEVMNDSPHEFDDLVSRVNNVYENHRVRREILDDEMFEEYIIRLCSDIDDLVLQCSKRTIFTKKRCREIISTISYMFDSILGYYEFIKIELPNERKAINEKFKSEIKQVECEIENIQKEIDQITNEKNSKLENKKNEINQQYNDEIEKINKQIISESMSDKSYSESEISNITSNANKKHLEESEALMDRLLEEFFIETIKNLTQKYSSIETCDNIEFYRCPDEFVKEIVLGKISYNYADDPKIGLFTYIVDTVNKFFMENDFKYNNVFEIPFVVDFEDFDGIEFVYDKNSEDFILDAYRSAIFHMFTDVQPGSFIFTMIDGKVPSGSFAPFSNFVKSDSTKYINYRIYNDTNGIELMAQEMRDQVTSRISNFNYKNIIEANRESVTKKELNLIYLVLDDSGVIKPNALKTIRTILSNGKKMGYSGFILHNDKIEWESSKGVKIESESIGDTQNLLIINGDFSFDLTMFKYPDEEKCHNIAERIAECYETMNDSTYDLIGSKVLESHMNEETIPGITVKAGIDVSNHICNFTLNDRSIHYLVIGKTGSGKSRFIHVLMSNILRKYSSEAVEIYTIDFKAGSLENRIFIKRNIPGVGMIFLNNNRYACMRFLESLYEEMCERTDNFDNNDTGSTFLHYKEYMEACKELSELEMNTFSRKIVFIDEIQELLYEDDDITKKCIEYISKMLNTARAFGIHLIISTQMLDNVKKIPLPILKSMNKAIFNCLFEDINALTEGDKKVIPENIASLTSANPGHGFIIDQFSCKEFIAPFYNSKQEEEILKEIEVTDRDKECNTRIFRNKIFDGISSPYVQFINDPKSVEFENNMQIGELVDFTYNLNSQRCKIKLNDPEEDNVLVVGDGGDTALKIFTTSVLSTALHLITTNKYKNSEFVFANCGEAGENDIICSLFERISEYDCFSTKYVPCYNINKTLCGMIRKYAEAVSQNVQREKVYLFIFGIQNKSELSEFYSMLKTLNEYGRNIHLIVWSSTFKPASVMLEETGLNMDDFKYKVYFGNNADDVEKVFGTKKTIEKEVIYLQKTNCNSEAFEFVPFEMDIYMPGNKNNMVNKLFTAIESALKNN